MEGANKAALVALHILAPINQDDAALESDALSRVQAKNDSLAVCVEPQHFDDAIIDDNIARLSPPSSTRNSDRIRNPKLDFPFLPTYTQRPYPAIMSLAYENRGFAEYPQSTIMDDHTAHEHMHHQQQNPSPPPQTTGDNLFYQINTLEQQIQELSQQHQKEVLENHTASPVPVTIVKPLREVRKDEEGRFVCPWSACTEAVQTFNRKCEWNKHMDKHDRPYKCTMEGCEKIPGFTYSGGLLRHEREVHNLHGGPRKQLNCPHPNCKRNSGKGFSRQENLNEHLRRVHTASTEKGQMPLSTEDTEEGELVQAGTKRKRVVQTSEPHEAINVQPVPDISRDMARIIQDNEALRRQVEMQNGQIQDLMRQLADVQMIVNGRAPQGMMHG